MPFNFNTQPQVIRQQQDVIKGASRSPFEIAGKAMSGLEDAIDNRIFNRDIQGVNSLDELSRMRVPQTKEAMANFAQKQGILGALQAQENQDTKFDLTRDANNIKSNSLLETLRHNIATEHKPFKPLGFGTATDPITGQTRIYNKDTGAFGDMTGGANTNSTDSGEMISSKTATIALPDGTTIYTNRAGEPLTRNGKTIIKARSKFNLEQPAKVSQNQATVNSIEKIIKNVQAHPDAVGSLGSDAWNFLANNINDMLKIPTGTRLSRNQIASASGVLAANIRSMYEKGVMTEPDFERYKKLVPNENDSYEEFINKSNILKGELIKSMNSTAEGQGTQKPSVSDSKKHYGMPTRTIGNETRYWDGTSWVK